MINEETPNQLDPQPNFDKKSVATTLEVIFNQEQREGEEDFLEMHVAPPITGLHGAVSDVTRTTPLCIPHQRRSSGRKRKKGTRNTKKQRAIEKRLKYMMEKLKPIPFIPLKILFFSKHERLMKNLGLWDFVHIDLDRNIRIELIVQLVATYDPKSGCSYVNDFRVAVNKTNVARALKLPLKKVKGNVGGVGGLDLDMRVLSEEEIEFLEEFVLDWVLLHEEEWLMPNEVSKWAGMISDGYPEEVDWAGLLWFMVEKELTRGEQLIDCYYASHLQYLIKSQHEKAFMLAEKVELDAGAEEEKDGNNEEDMKDGDIPEVREEECGVMEWMSIELTLGQNVREKEEEMKDVKMLDAGKCKEKVADQGQWLLDGNKNAREHYKKNCMVEQGRRGSIFDSEKEKKEIEEKLEDGFHVLSKKLADQRQSLWDGKNNAGEHYMETCNVEEGRRCNCLENEKEKKEIEEQKAEGGFHILADKETDQAKWLSKGKNNSAEHYMKSSSMNKGRKCNSLENEKEKKEIEEKAEDGFFVLPNDDVFGSDGLSRNLVQAMFGNHIIFSAQEQLCERSQVDLSSNVQKMATVPSISYKADKPVSLLDNDNSHHSLSDRDKRLRIKDYWDHKAVGFEMCMEQMQQSVERAKMLYEENERNQQRLNMNQQHLFNELQRRDRAVEHLHMTKLEEIQARDRELYRLRRELYLMSSTVDGYRKAVKETQKAFAEYRGKFQLPEEPYYKDAGHTGLMLSTAEIEKLHKKPEEEHRLNCLFIEEMVKEAEKGYADRFKAYHMTINLLDKKLTGLENVMNVLTLSYTKLKISGNEEKTSAVLKS